MIFFAVPAWSAGCLGALYRPLRILFEQHVYILGVSVRAYWYPIVRSFSINFRMKFNLTVYQLNIYLILPQVGTDVKLMSMVKAVNTEAPIWYAQVNIMTCLLLGKYMHTKDVI